MERRSFLLGSVGLAALGATGCASGATPDPTGAPSSDLGGGDRPPGNVIVIYADDMRLDELPFMPFVSSLAAQGTEFSLARQMTPLCSPARAGFLRGQYPVGPQGHGIVSQSSKVAPLESDTLPT